MPTRVLYSLIIPSTSIDDALEGLPVRECECPCPWARACAFARVRGMRQLTPQLFAADATHDRRARRAQSRSKRMVGRLQRDGGQTYAERGRKDGPETSAGWALGRWGTHKGCLLSGAPYTPSTMLDVRVRRWV